MSKDDDFSVVIELVVAFVGGWMLGVAMALSVVLGLLWTAAQL